MLDKRGIVLLKFLYTACNQSGYKIFSIKEIMESVSKQVPFDAESVQNYIDELVKRELISVRYEDEKEVCLSVTLKGRLLCETSEEDKKEKSKTDKRFFIYSFIGAFLGSIVVFSLILIACFCLGGKLCLPK